MQRFIRVIYGNKYECLCYVESSFICSPLLTDKCVIFLMCSYKAFKYFPGATYVQYFVPSYPGNFHFQVAVIAWYT